MRVEGYIMAKSSNNAHMFREVLLALSLISLSLPAVVAAPIYAKTATPISVRAADETVRVKHLNCQANHLQFDKQANAHELRMLPRKELEFDQGF